MAEDVQSAHPDIQFLSAPLVDFEKLLAPIHDESPAGEDLREQGIFYETEDILIKAREAARAGNQNGVVNPNLWADVIKATEDILQTRSKDLKVTIWMAEALTRQYGVTGLRDGLRLLWQIQEKFWSVLFPNAQDGEIDITGRIRLLASSAEPLRHALAITPLFQGLRDEYYTWWDWDSARNRPKDTQITIKQIEEAIAKTPYEDCEILLADLSQALAECTLLESVVEENIATTIRTTASYLSKFMLQKGLDPKNTDDHSKALRLALDEAPRWSMIKEVIQECCSLLEPSVRVKREQRDQRAPLRLPTPSSPQGKTDLLSQTSNVNHENGVRQNLHPSSLEHPAVSLFEPHSRLDALQRLRSIAEFFRNTEPHSPVSYLVDRAVRWGEMPLEEWLQEVVSEQNVLTHIRDTLGIKDKKTTA